MKLSHSGIAAICVWAIILCFIQTTNAADGKIKVTTYTYKKVGDLEIKADVHRADDDKTRPVMVWIHGGALINGHRAGISGRVKKTMLDAGYVIVSIDYRLAPETQLPPREFPLQEH